MLNATFFDVDFASDRWTKLEVCWAVEDGMFGSAQPEWAGLGVATSSDGTLTVILAHKANIDRSQERCWQSFLSAGGSGA